MMCSMGCLVHALNPARASEAPITFRKPRRDTSSAHSEACRGNSRCSISWKPSVLESSSRLRQYVGPVALVSASRTFARSSGCASTGFFARSVLQSLLKSQFPVFSCQNPKPSFVHIGTTQQPKLGTGYWVLGTHRWHVEQLVISRGARMWFSLIKRCPNPVPSELRCSVNVSGPLPKSRSEERRVGKECRMRGGRSEFE